VHEIQTFEKDMKQPFKQKTNATSLQQQNRRTSKILNNSFDKIINKEKSAAMYSYLGVKEISIIILVH
jgi:hypothetical protein